MALLYLLSPVAVFFAFFVRVELAVPACGILLYTIYDAAKNTRWVIKSTDLKLCLYFGLVAAIWLWLGGAGRTLFQGRDWIKHYGVLNELIEDRWPPVVRVEGQELGALRYYIAWYLVPAATLKITGWHAQSIALSVWSFIGVVIFFKLTSKIFTSILSVILSPLVFIFFSGADIIGTAITHIQIGPRFHIEWWSSWIEYASNTVSLYWVPQHALAAWLMVALIMHQTHRRTVLPVLGVAMASIALWSPFSALGVAPFYAALITRYGIKELALNWRTWSAIFFIFLPIFAYLDAGATNIPHGFAWNLPCGAATGYCFTTRTYLLFIVIEVAAPLIMLSFSRMDFSEFLVVSAIMLVLLPFIKIGIGNDLATRGSIGALAMISILCAQALLEGSLPITIAMSAILLVGIATPAGEMLRPFFEANHISENSRLADVLAIRSDFKFQYLAPLPIWIIRTEP